MDSFYSVKGNEVSKDMIVADFINNYEGNLTDFNEGSEIRNLIEAFAVYAMGLEERINDLLYVIDIMNADDEYLDLLASQPRIDMTRIEGVEATGEVLFTVQNALTEDLLIPAGTIVSSDTGMDFETMTDNKIMPGELSTTCRVEALEVGIDGNIPANSIVTKEDGYDAVAGFTISNPDPFTGGLDFEEDDDFRNRILEKMGLAKFGSQPYYISILGSEFPEAHDIFFNDNSDSYDAVVTPNTYKGSAAQTKLEMDILAYLSDDNNKLLRHTFNVSTPVVKTVNVYFQDTVGTSTGFYVKLSSYDTATVDKAKQVFDCYLKGGDLDFVTGGFRGLNLTEELNMYDLVQNVGNYLGELFVSFAEYGDAHSFSSSENKYAWSYHV